MPGRRIVLVALVGLNVALAAGWAVSARRATVRSAAGAELGEAGTVRYKTNAVVRRQFFSWQEVESADYSTYIANLREIGCPEQTIRDIIVADVNQLYARRVTSRIPTADQHWWSKQAGPELGAAIERVRRELEAERQGLLTRLLGTNWNVSAAAAAARPADRLPLEGPVLGSLPAETKLAVRNIVDQAQTEARNLGLGPDKPAEVVKYEKELWTKLAGVMSAAQLEEFRLRYSPNAAAWRNDLSGLKNFRVTPDEFRKLFRATDEIDNQIRALGEATDSVTQERRQGLEQQREAAVRESLGAARFTQFAQVEDTAYQDAVTRAQAAGASDKSVDAIYKINQAVADEQARIQNDPTLTDTQKAIESKKIEVEQLKAQAQALGQELPPEPAPPAPPPPKSLSTINHTIGSQETLNTLSRLYGVTPQALQDANPNLNLNSLKPGDKVNVPYLAPPPPPPPQ